MDAIFIILYAVILTMVLVFVFPRLRQPSPAQRRNLWISLIIGGIALLVVTTVAFLK